MLVMVLLAVRDEDAVPRRHHQLVRARGQSRRARGSRTPSGTATCVPPSTGAVRPAAACAPSRPRVGVDRRDQRLGQLVDVPGRVRALPAYGEEAAREVDQLGGSVVERDDRHPSRRRPAAAPAARPARPARGRSVRSDQVAATVVEHEQEPAGQVRQRGVGAQQPVELVGDRAQVGRGRRRARSAARPSRCGPARGCATAAARWPRSRRPRRPGGRRRRPAWRAAAGWPARSGGRRRRRTCCATSPSARSDATGEAAADQPQPDQPAVVGRPRAEHAGAAVPAGALRADCGRWHGGPR